MKKKKKPKKPWALTLKEAGLNPKKEIALMIVGNIFLIAVAFLAYKVTKVLIASLSIVLLAIVGDYFLLGKASRVKKVKYEALEKERAARKEQEDRDRRVQKAVLEIRKRFGNNAIVKGMNLEEGATAIQRNSQIGGHNA